MQSQYYSYYIYLNRITRGHHIKVIDRLQELINLKRSIKPPGRMDSYLDKSRKCIADIQKTADQLKMKLLRSAVPCELFKSELNSIVDKCSILIADSISISSTQELPSRSETFNEDLNIGDNFFDEDPFDYDIARTNVSKIPEKESEDLTPKTALDKAIARSTSKLTSSRKRKSICISEPVSKTAENLHQSRNFTEDDNGWVTAFIDGSCLGNGKGGARAGLGVWFSASSALNLSEPVKGRLTNNVGEIEAAIRAIEQAHSVGISKLVLKTDSMFLINCIMKWRLTWEKNGWKTSANKPVINRLEIQKLTKTLDDTKVAVRWEHVKAHSNIIGNEAADFLAKQGAEKCELREFLK